jgi:hypothetical protein
MNDLNYTPLDQNSSVLEDDYFQRVDFETGEVLRVLEPTEVPEGNVGPGRAPLSTVHKRPFVEFYAGAGLLKVSRGIVSDAPAGGKKGKITGFSFASRRAMLRMVASIKIDSILPMFCTITYPDIFPSASESKRQLRIFIKRLLRAFPDIGIIWKLEPQERGAPHYHFLIWGAAENLLFEFFVEHWHQIAGGEDPNHKLLLLGALKGSKPCVEAVRSRRGVMRYASKYLAKAFDVSGWNNEHHGRYWAVVNRENIPFGVKCVYEISLQKANHIMRYQKRFSRIKKLLNSSSLTTFCDADQWTKNIFSEVIEKQ